LNINITIAKKISECKAAWDDLLPHDHHLRARHLQAFENAAVDHIENNYVQVFFKEKLIGVVYLQLFQFKQQHLNISPQSGLLSRCLSFILPAKLPLLVCGHLLRIDFEGYYFKSPAHPSLVFEAVTLFNRQNNCKPGAVIIKDCEAIFIEKYYRPFRYHFFNGDVTMELKRKDHWKNFDDYLKDLQKNYLQRAKKILQAFDTVQIKELNADEIKTNAADIEKLYWNVVNKQTVKLGTVNAGYFYELKKDLQQNFEFNGLYLQGVLVGFYTYIFYNNKMETHYIGLDYEANKKFKLYFNILFLSTKKMIDRNYDILELGRTAREAKLNLGAVHRQVINYINIKNPVVKMAVYFILKRLNNNAKDQFTGRTPLK
jgi:hypothetical protein